MKEKEAELWKEIPGYQGYYASNLGRVASYGKKGKGFFILKQSKCRDREYVTSTVTRDDGCKGPVLVHTLIGITWLPMESYTGYEIDHINRIKDDNRVSNLEWVTHEENMRRAIGSGATKNPDEYPNGIYVIDGEKYSSYAKLATDYHIRGNTVAWAFSQGRTDLKGHHIYLINTKNKYLDLDSGNIINGESKGVFWW